MRVILTLEIRPRQEPPRLELPPPSAEPASQAGGLPLRSLIIMLLALLAGAAAAVGAAATPAHPAIWAAAGITAACGTAWELDRHVRRD